LYEFLVQLLGDKKQQNQSVLVIFFTNGSFDGIMKKLVKNLTSLS